MKYINSQILSLFADFVFDREKYYKQNPYIPKIMNGLGITESQHKLELESGSKRLISYKILSKELECLTKEQLLEAGQTIGKILNNEYKQLLLDLISLTIMRQSAGVSSVENLTDGELPEIY